MNHLNGSEHKVLADVLRSAVRRSRGCAFLPEAYILAAMVLNKLLRLRVLHVIIAIYPPGWRASRETASFSSLSSLSACPKSSDISARISRISLANSKHFSSD